MAERFPKNCWDKKCPHFHTRDLSIDDLVCTCDLLKISCDACDEDFCLYLCPLPNDTRTPKERGADNPKITCLNCKHLMFSDMYGECNKQLKIVNPSDTCEYAEPEERGGEK